MKEIIDGCIREDKVAQKTLYDMFSKKMMGVCYRYAKDMMEAEDMLQEGFIKVFDNISRYGYKGSFEGWVRRIFVNNAINKIRSRKNELEYKDELNCDVEYEVTEDTMDKLNHVELLKLIDKLPKGYKTVFNLYAVDGYSHKEIAQRLNIRECTSRTQYSKSKRFLRKLINDRF
jgi:RNA polymerase sigma-70 factor (ECF subfamily)